jgi:hypothetical protein
MNIKEFFGFAVTSLLCAVFVGLATHNFLWMMATYCALYSLFFLLLTLRGK